LYDYVKFNSKHRDIDSMKRFDFLDMVIIDIDPSILPWQTISQDVALLIKMCKAIEKPLLVMGGAFS